jgi:L-ascorbate metabolism protein UlaG (beta-lactamase superfamily)
MNRLLTLLCLCLLAISIASCTGAPRYDGPRSSHFDGNNFANTVPMSKGAGDIMKLGWGMVTEAETWPDWVEITPRPVDSERVHEGMTVTYINHASFLVQVDGLNILTDPIYSKRASPFQWTGPARVHQPGVRFEDLPPIDVVLISHNHYDHLDEATLKRFAEMAEQPLILSGLGNGRLFEKWGLGEHRDLDWEESQRLGEVEITFTECRHRSGRGIGDQMKTLWGAFVIKTSAGNIYFAGDSGYGGHFQDAGYRHGPFALSLLPIGAYDPRWFMKDVHVNPAEAVQAHRDLGSELSIGMHFNTFQLTYEGIDEPEIDLAAALREARIAPDRFITLAPGAAITKGAGEPIPAHLGGYGAAGPYTGQLEPGLDTEETMHERQPLPRR